NEQRPDSWGLSAVRPFFGTWASEPPCLEKNSPCKARPRLPPPLFPGRFRLDSCWLLSPRSDPRRAFFFRPPASGRADAVEPVGRVRLRQYAMIHQLIENPKHATNGHMLRLRRATHAAITGQQASLQPDGEQDAGCIRQA